MNGFKDGAAGDAFGDDDDDDSETEDETAAAADPVDDRAGASSASEPDVSTTSSTENTSTTGSTELPWLYRRSSITDGREKTVQLHLQSSTLDEQRDALSTVEKRLGESVNKADLREAAFLVGLRHLDEVAEQLREWGYDVE